MYLRRQLLIIGLISLLALVLGASAATASRSISIEPGSGLTASARLQLGDAVGRLPRTTSIICDVTLLKSLARAIPKTPGTRFGKITGFSIDRGTSGSPHCISELNPIEEVTPLLSEGRSCPHRELGSGVLSYDCSTAPAESWALVYDSYQGTLPRISGINFHITGVRFRLRINGIDCLYGRSEPVYGLAEVNAEGRVTGATPVLERTALRLLEESSPLCPFAVGSFSGTFTLHQSQRISLV